MKHILAFLLLCLCLTAKPQRIVWWNVENLFDCQHDSLKEDYDFLPEGQYHWTKGRYWKKLDNISRTIAAIADEDNVITLLLFAFRLGLGYAQKRCDKTEQEYNLLHNGF